MCDGDLGVLLGGQARMGAAANDAARQRVFGAFLQRKSPNTIRRYRADLAVYARYLIAAAQHRFPSDAARTATITAVAEQLRTSPQAWIGTTWGLVEAFVVWMIQDGYAIRSVSARLSTVRLFCGLAAKAEVIPPHEYQMIKGVQAFGGKEGMNVDQQRTQTRKPRSKKAEALCLTLAQVRALKLQPLTTPQGRRNRLLMCLLLDHGLRESEIIDLRIEHIDMDARSFTFYRKKVKKVQTHEMSVDVRRALDAYLADLPDTYGPLLRASLKNKQITPDKRSGGTPTATPVQNAASTGVQAPAPRRNDLSPAGIWKIVRALGVAIGVPTLAPHDCRHTWATWANRAGTDVKTLQTAGGWSTPHMPLAYMVENQIANEQMKLPAHY